MKEVLNQLASYYSWANQRLLQVILLLNEEQQHRKLPSSFPSLFETLAHMYHADVIWWKHVQHETVTPSPLDSFGGTMEQLAGLSIEQCKKWESWVHASGEAMLSGEIQYRNTRGDSFRQPCWQMLLQLFNHGTYHRGQLVTMLKQLGVNKIPATDFIVWSREVF